MAERLLDVAEVRFTQEHIYDSFNANSARAGGVVELIDAILAGAKTPRDLPLIRVAAKRGAYWCVDNRRLFVYKHCQLGEIPMQVFGWKDSREFELKWRNGLASRSQTSEGRRVGVLQRTAVPFPRSPVIEPSLSSIRRHLPPRLQRLHDAGIACLGARREATVAAAAAAAGGAALEGADALAPAEALRGLLLLQRPPSAAGPERARPRATTPLPRTTTSGRRRRPRRPVTPAEDGAGEAEADAEAEAEGGVPPEATDATTVARPRRAKRRKRPPSARISGVATSAFGASGAASPRPRPPIARRAAAGAPAAARASAACAAAGAGCWRGATGATAGAAAGAAAGGRGASLTVALGGEGSSDEAYDVEVRAL